MNKIPGGCWEWTASLTKGYGQFRLGKMFKAHRLSALWAGILPSMDSGLLVCHHCDNPRCVNPKHLFVGSHKDNIQDSTKKGRQQPALAERGEANHQAKLTKQDVLDIRRLYATGRFTHNGLGIRFSISPSTIGSIINRQRWTHI